MIRVLSASQHRRDRSDNIPDHTLSQHICLCVTQTDRRASCDVGTQGLLRPICCTGLEAYVVVSETDWIKGIRHRR